MRLLLLIFLIQISLGTLAAQSSVDPALNLAERDILSSSSDAYIQQVGTNNSAEINQKQRRGQQFNQAVIIQQGADNAARIAQRGRGNQSAVLQNGNGNLYDLVITGRNNNINIVQRGDNNEITQRVRGFVGVNVDFQQIGNDNSIIQELNGIKDQAFKITQRGNGLSVQITTDNY